jgi:Ser/Thr protein kinase RdoA (MazF antagonist)
MAKQDPSLPLPRACLSLDKQQIHRLELNGNEHFVRVVTYLSGRLLDDLPKDRRDQNLMVSMGQFLGRLDRGLSDFFHPAAGHALLWDLQQTPNLHQHLSHIKNKNNLLTAQKTLDHFQEHIAPKFSMLRTQVIHNDMNPDNVVVNESDTSQVTGMIDFGDLVYAPLINDPAVAAAYQTVSCADLFLGTTDILKGYHSINPLQEQEMDLLPSLIVNRIAMTAIISEWRAKEHPENQDYILGNISRTWEVLNRLHKQEYADIAGRLKNSLN